MRGKHRNCRQYAYQHGITPAGAGKTRYFCHFNSPSGDHPRRCGENRREFPSSAATGITPAGAGKTQFGHPYTKRTWDHPRRCGENRGRVPCPPTERGSPPQVRGKQGCHTVKILSGGITPAGAGKTGHAHGVRHRHTDHPRRCGENAVKAANTGTHVGSPPQVRGKRRSSQTAETRTRITPAGAGKTARHLRFSKRNRDHPRRCGENQKSHTAAKTYRGSPPQVRGKPLRDWSGCPLAGITPAGAGKTSRRRILRGLSADHPRRCGENAGFFDDPRAELGSPPQVRGKRRR